MKKNEKLRRLLLNCETIRSLDDRKLLEVVGGLGQTGSQCRTEC